MYTREVHCVAVSEIGSHVYVIINTYLHRVIYTHTRTHVRVRTPHTHTQHSPAPGPPPQGVGPPQPTSARPSSSNPSAAAAAGGFKFSVPETLDHIKEEFGFLQNQTQK